MRTRVLRCGPVTLMTRVHDRGDRDAMRQERTGELVDSSAGRGYVMRYEANPKHKPVATPGRHGSICPTGVDSAQLLADSVLVGKKRFATDGHDAFCGQCHDAVRDRWHGYPVDWTEVPPEIIRQWVADGRVNRRAVRRPRRRASDER